MANQETETVRYCAELEVQYEAHEHDKEFVNYDISALNNAMRECAINRVLDDGGSVVSLHCFTKVTKCCGVNNDCNRV